MCVCVLDCLVRSLRITKVETQVDVAGDLIETTSWWCIHVLECFIKALRKKAVDNSDGCVGVTLITVVNCLITECLDEAFQHIVLECLLRTLSINEDDTHVDAAGAGLLGAVGWMCDHVLEFLVRVFRIY